MPALHYSCVKHCDCEPPDSVEEAYAKLERLTAAFGFDRFAFGLLDGHRHLGLSPLVISNFPEEWLDRYVQRRYRQIDPILMAASCSVRPFFWDRADSCAGIASSSAGCWRRWARLG